MTRRGREGRWGDVAIYVAVALALVVAAILTGWGGLTVAALIPLGFGVWRANAD